MDYPHNTHHLLLDAVVTLPPGETPEKQDPGLLITASETMVKL